jgi:hypothetical protein
MSNISEFHEKIRKKNSSASGGLKRCNNIMITTGHDIGIMLS